MECGRWIVEALFFIAGIDMGLYTKKERKVKRYLRIILGIIICLVGTIGVSGMGVMADNSSRLIVEQRLTFEDLVEMSDSELARVPMDIIQGILDQVYKEGRDNFKYELEDLKRIEAQQSQNQSRAMFDEMAATVPNTTLNSDLEIGWSITVYNAEIGEYGTSGFGLLDSNVDLDTNTGEAYTATIVWGNPYAYAWSGHSFDISGSGYGLYRIDIDASWVCTSINYGVNRLSLVVEQIGGSSATYIIDEYSALAGNEHARQFDYSAPYYVPLYAGNTYRVSLLLESDTDNWGEALADCMSGYYRSWWDTIHLEYIS